MPVSLTMISSASVARGFSRESIRPMTVIEPPSGVYLTVLLMKGGRRLFGWPRGDLDGAQDAPCWKFPASESALFHGFGHRAADALNDRVNGNWHGRELQFAPVNFGNIQHTFDNAVQAFHPTGNPFEQVAVISVLAHRGVFVEHLGVALNDRERCPGLVGRQC